MADIRLAKPAAGTTQTVPSAPDGRFIFDFPADAATLTRNGDDLVLTFLDEDLMPAAGPAASSSASRGGRYNEYGGSDLLDGIDHLGRLDIGFDDGVEWADDEVGGWTHQNLDPEISGIIAVDGNDMTLVESGVETVPGEDIQDNTHTPGVPVVVGQVVAHDPDGGSLSYSFAGGANSITTEYGVITIDAATGVITYTLHNDDPDTNSLKLDETVTEKFSVIVRDNMGGSAQASFTVTIKGTNDQPEVSVDAYDKPGDEYTVYEEGHGRTDTNEVVKDWSGTGDPQASENADYAYNDTNKGGTVSGQLIGHDVDHDAELTFGAAHGTPTGNPAPSDFVGSSPAGGDAKEVPGTFGTLTLESNGTWTYTLKDNQSVGQEFTATLEDGTSIPVSSIDALPEGATVTETFTFYVKDEHGAWHSETKTITITGTNDKPTLTLKDAQGNVVEAPLVTEESEPSEDNSTTHWDKITGEFEVADVDADAGSDQTLLIKGGTYTSEGKEYTTSHVEESDPQPGHIDNGTGTSATFTTDYGTLTVNPNGTWTYEVNGESLKVQELDPNNPHYETFEVTVVDEHGAYNTQTIVIKLDGESAYPVITDHVDLVFKEEGVYYDDSDGNTETTKSDTVVDENGEAILDHHSETKLEGQVTATDVDISDKGNLTFSVEATGTTLTTNGEPAASQPNTPQPGTPTSDGAIVYESDYGTLTFYPDGRYTYELNSDAFDADDNAVNKLAQGQVLTETFTVTVTDTFNKSVTQDITITIHGTNDKPRLELGGGSDDKGSLHVMESGVGRHEDGTVVDGPDDEIPGETGSPQDEVRGYTEDKNDSGNAAGADADNNAHLVYGAAKDNVESPADVDFTEGGKASVIVEGQYGTLTIEADGNYSYELDEDKSFSKDGQTYNSLDQLNEGEELHETFTIFVKDEYGAWASKEVTVTVTGTNDRPELTVTDEKAFYNDKDQLVDGGDGYLHAYGTASDESAVTTLHGRVQATDADRENGAGATTTSKENHGLEFSLQEKGYDSTLTSSSVWTYDGKEQMGAVNVTQNGGTATTLYGTLTLDQYGNYTYELKENDAVTKLGEGETVTETFVVRVVDDRGAWSEKTITITIEGTNDKPVISDDSSSLTVHEEGVWGSQDDTHTPDAEFTGNTGKQTGTVHFEEKDANDTHSLVIADGLPNGADLNVVYPAGYEESGSDATYTITENTDGTYTLTATIPGVNNGDSITLGTLTLEQKGADGELTYTFTPNQGDLNGLPQDMDLSIDIPLKVKDEHGSLSDTTHTATINIHGTNDRPTIKIEAKAEDVYTDGVGRNPDGTAVDTDNGKDLNPAENKVYESQKVEGRLTADDADADHELTFFVKEVQITGKGNPLKCTVNETENSVTLTLDGGEVAKLVLDQKTGEYTLELLDTDEARTVLKPYGEDVKFDFTVHFNVRDEHGSTAQSSASQKFSIHGTNDAPTITHVEDQDLAEDEASVTGNVTASDADSGDKLTYGLLDDDGYNKLMDPDGSESVEMQDTLKTDYGTLEIDPETGEYTFYLNTEHPEIIGLSEDDTKSLTFHVAVRDDKGAWNVEEIIITVTGKDTATVFTGDAAVVTVEEKGFGHFPHPTEADPDRGDPSFASGRLEAEEFDTDADGKPHDVEFSIKTQDGEQAPRTDSFNDLTEVQGAINGQFSGEDAWADDAGIQILKGTYGTLYLNTATGQYFYQLNNEWDATQKLELGQIEYDKFTIHAKGTGAQDELGADQPLTVAVKGSNDAPVLERVLLDEASIEAGLEVEGDGFTVKGLEEDGVTTATGTIAATDVDSPDTGEDNVLKYLIKVEDGGDVRYLGAWDNGLGYLKLDENTGDYTFVFYNDKDEFQHLKEGETKDVTFTVVAVDEHNAVSEERELTFTITGKDDVPVITGSSDSITEDDRGTDELSATISDDDDGATPEITKITSKTGGGSADLTGDGPWTIEGEYGILTVTRENGELKYSYTLHTEEENPESYEKRQELNVDSPSLEETFTVHGKSGDKDAQGTITITITGENDAPTLKLEYDAGTETTVDGAITVDGWDPVKGEAHGEDVDNIWEPDGESELRYSVSNGENPGSEPGEGSEEQASSLQTIKGEFGYLTINSVTGEYTYVVDPFSDKYKELESSEESGKETFTIWVKDPHGAFDRQDISFDVHWKGSEGSGGSIPLAPTTDVAVKEDGGNYDVTLPPSVDSGLILLETTDDSKVTVNADQIWLEDAEGNKSHVIQTDYGSLILEKNENSEWGYRFVLNNSSEAVQELTEKDEIDLTFWVGTEERKGVPINVTITGINDRPVIDAVTDLTVKDTGGEDTGQIVTTDPDKVDVGSAEEGVPNLSYEITANSESVTLTRDDGGTGYGPGTYTVKKDGEVLGKFTLKEDGSYSFTPDEGIADGLPAGDSKGFDLTITVKDDSGQENDSASDTIHVTIEGTNKEPDIIQVPPLEVKEDVTLTNGQQLVVSDDRGESSDNLSYSVAAGDATGEGKPMAAGEYGTLFIDANGNYHYQLNNQLPAVQQLGEGAPLTDTFTIFVKDKDGATVPTTVTVTINGTNDAPVLSLDTPVLTIKEGQTAVSGEASATDVDTGDTQTYSLKDEHGNPVGELNAQGEYVYKTTYGTFYLDKTTGEYRFVLNNDAEAVKNLRPTDVVEDKITVVVTDGYGGTSEKELTVHIKGDNTAPEVTDEESLELTVLEDVGENSGQIDATGWDSGPNNTGSDPLHYSAENAKPVTIDGKVWHKVAGEHGILYINPKTGEYRYELTEDMNYLADGESALDDFNITITDSTGLKTEETIKVTIEGENDAPRIVVSQPSSSQSGTVTITDVDTKDTHDVTFTGLYGSAEDATNGTALQVDLTKLENGKPLDVFNAAGEKIGELELTYTESSDGKNGGTLEYTFTPDKEYLNSLPVDQDKDINFSITVSDGHEGGTATQGGLHFTVTNENDKPVIMEATDPSAEGNNNSGKLKFSDADELDTQHSVTFTELQDAGGNALVVESVEGLTEDKVVDVYKDGLQIGTLTLRYEDGELTYTLSTENFENNLPVGPSDITFTIMVSDKHNGTATTEDLDFSVSNVNDAPVISDESTGPNTDNTGTLVFTDADVKDTHSVTFGGLSADASDTTPLTVDLGSLTEEPITVYQDGQKVGELTLTYSKGEDGTGTFTYAFDPDKTYLNSLPVGENKLDFGITVSDKNGREDTTGDLQFTVTNENDAPVITGETSEGNNTGTLVFSDADVRDTHSVTFEGLYASESGKEGDSLKVDNVEGLTDGTTTLDVYNESGQKIGTLKLAYTEGDGAGTEHTLTYTFTPDTEYSNSLDRDSSVSLDFDLKIHDDTEDSNTVKGSVTIESTNQAPVIGAPVDDGSNTGTVAITDSDPDDSLTVSIKDGEGNIHTITAEAEVVDGVRYTYTDGTLRYEVLPERTEGMEPGATGTYKVTVVVDDGHGKVEQTVSLPVTSTAPTEGGEGEGPTEGETVIVPDDGDQASLKAYGQRQRLAAEEAGLLTAAASFVAGITPEPADPETFLQESVPAAQDDIPEALMAEEIPLPQGETVLQEETADLPDADVPVSEMPLADDLLAEPLLFAGLESTEGMLEPVETLRPETADETLLAEEIDPVTAGTPPAFGGEEAGDGGLLLPEGVEGLFGTDGDDYLRGGEGSDAIFGGAGNDIIVYDQQDYLVSGGSGIDFMVSDDTSLTLDGLLSNTSSDKPLVSGIEVLLKGEDALSLTSINDLADRYGITLGVNEAGEETLQLDDRWTKQDDGSYDFNGGAEADGGLTLETSLTPVETGDPASEAVQQQVFTLEHSNG